MTAKIEVTPCLLPDCAYVRPWTDSDEWLNRVIEHPAYGPIAEWQLVQYDLRTHRHIRKETK